MTVMAGVLMVAVTGGIGIGGVVALLGDMDTAAMDMVATAAIPGAGDTAAGIPVGVTMEVGAMAIIQRSSRLR